MEIVISDHARTLLLLALCIIRARHALCIGNDQHNHQAGTGCMHFAGVAPGASYRLLHAPADLSGAEAQALRRVTLKRSMLRDHLLSHYTAALTALEQAAKERTCMAVAEGSGMQ